MPKLKEKHNNKITDLGNNANNINSRKIPLFCDINVNNNEKNKKI